jgi:hypothetical protein
LNALDYGSISQHSPMSDDPYPHVFRIEHPSTPESMRELIGLLEIWLGDNHEPKRMFAVWIRAALMRRNDYTLVLPEVQSLKEINMALAERMAQWAEAYKAEGLQKGVQEGLQKGLQKGQQEGRQQGEALALQKLLLKRFGAIPPALMGQVAGASLAQIELWFDSAIDASALADVFK